MRDIYEDVRDFIVLHYKATTRDDTPFWDHCRTMEIPDRLARRLDLFRSKGRIFRDGAELFGNASWVAVCMGQHIVPQDYEPAVDALDEAKVTAALEQIRRGYIETAQRLPTHGDFVRHCCENAPRRTPPPPRPVAPASVPTFSFESESPFATPGSPI